MHENVARPAPSGPSEDRRDACDALRDGRCIRRDGGLRLEHAVKQIALSPRRRLRRAATSSTSGPVGGLYDHRFQYARACETDIRRTFRRVRAEQKKGLRL